MMVVGPTQSGKTTGLVVPAMSEWDGPVLATSIKTDVLVQTLAARSELGEARVFDPTQATSLGHAVWSPLSASTTWTGARRTAAALLGVGDHTRRPLRRRRVLAPGGRALPRRAPVRGHQGHRPHDGRRPALDRDLGVRRADQAARRLRSRAARRRRSTRSSRSRAPTTASPRACCRRSRPRSTPGRSRRSPARRWANHGSAPTGCSTAPTRSTSSRPPNDQRRLSGLFAALVAHIVAGAYERSAKTGRPIEPALLLALDEVCNIAPLPNLDEIASTGPGQGVHLLCVLQNISQSYDRWGRDRAETIIANHRARLFCSGIGDRATLDYLRGTLGEEEIARISTQQRGIAVPGARTHSTEHRPLATPHRVRQADRSTACSSTAASRPPGSPSAPATTPPTGRPAPPAPRTRATADRVAEDVDTTRGPERPPGCSACDSAGTETAHGFPPACSDPGIAFAQCRRPAAGRLQGRLTSPFPSPAGSVPRPAAGRHFGLRQPPDPHKEGTKDERLSTRS